MSRGRTREVHDDESPVGIRLGRRAPYTQLGDWVMLAPTSIVRHAAKVLYWALSAHLNVKQSEDGTGPDPQVNPTLEMLAQMLGYSRKDKLLPYIDDLVVLGAIEVSSDLVPGEGNRRRNTYTIHQSPPEEYEHHESLGEFYRAFRKAKAAERAEKRAARAAEIAARAAETATNQGVAESPVGVSGTESPDRVSGPESPVGVPDIEQDVGTRRKNKIGGRDAAPRTPAFRSAGHATSLVTMSGNQQSNHQTARAGVRAEAEENAKTDSESQPINPSASVRRSPDAPPVRYRRAPVRRPTTRTTPAIARESDAVPLASAPGGA